MRRRTQLAVVAGGATAVIAGGAVLRGRLGGRGPESLPLDDDAQFTLFAPGGKFAFWSNGPVGWVMARVMPMMEAGLYETVAEMLDLQPEDELLDICCGPGAFLALKARHVHRVVGLDSSRVMLREAERRLADRLSAGTARLVTGSAAALPFDDGEFSAVTAINGPIKHAEAFRVLRPGGRLVFVDPDPRRSPKQPAVVSGVRWPDEADHRRMFEDAGFTDVTVRYRGFQPLSESALLLGCRKPGTPPGNAAVGVGNRQELAGTTAPA